MPSEVPPAAPEKSGSGPWGSAVILLLLLLAAFGGPYLKPAEVYPMGVKVPRGQWTVEVTPVSPEAAVVGHDVNFSARLVYSGSGTPPPPPKSVLIRRNDTSEPVRVMFDAGATTQKFTVRPQHADKLELMGWDHYLASGKPLTLQPKVEAKPAKPPAQMEIVVQPRWSMARLEDDRWRLPIGIGLVDKAIYRNENRIQFMRSPETITVHLDSYGGSLSKDELSIAKDAYRSDTEVDFVTSVPSGNWIAMSWVRPGIPFDSNKVPIACSSLLFDASVDPQRVAADGFTPARLFIRLVHEHDGSLASLTGGRARVQLTHSLGSSIKAKPEALQFEKGELGKFVDLSSSGPGENAVTLYTTPFRSRVQAVKVSYYFPWVAIILSLVGSIIGSAGDVLHRRISKRSRPSWKSIVLRGLIGAIASLMAWFGLKQGLSGVSVLGFALSAPCSTQGSLFMGMFVGFSAFKILGNFKALAGSE